MRQRETDGQISRQTNGDRRCFIKIAKTFTRTNFNYESPEHNQWKRVGYTNLSLTTESKHGK